jgi:hypothetical protein
MCYVACIPYTRPMQHNTQFARYHCLHSLEFICMKGILYTSSASQNQQSTGSTKFLPVPIYLA